MFLLRLLLFLSVAAIAGAVLAWMITGRRDYLAFAWRIAKLALLLVALIFGLMAAERLLTLTL